MPKCPCSWPEIVVPANCSLSYFLTWLSIFLRYSRIKEKSPSRTLHGWDFLKQQESLTASNGHFLFQMRSTEMQDICRPRTCFNRKLFFLGERFAE